jgi:hypothetical protein
LILSRHELIYFYFILFFGVMKGSWPSDLLDVSWVISHGKKARGGWGVYWNNAPTIETSLNLPMYVKH